MIYLGEPNLQRLNNLLRKGHLPNLSELFVDACKVDKIRTLLYKFDLRNTSKLETLTLNNFCAVSHQESKCLSELSSLQLCKLDMSGTRAIKGSLPQVFTHCFSILNTLILTNCMLNSNDIQNLAKAEVEGKLPQLRYLDVSGLQTFEMSEMFTDSAQWKQLKTLVTSHISVMNIESVFLASLEKLHLEWQITKTPMTVTRCWSHLKVIRLHSAGFLWYIADGVERGKFSSLTTIRLVSGGYIKTSLLLKLYKANISVQNIYGTSYWELP